MDSVKIVLKDNDIPKYVQIYLYYKRLVELNRLKDGDKMPTIRSLSEQLKVNKLTIINAYKKLEEEGYVIQKIGSGTFIRKNDGYKNIKKQYSDTFKRINAGLLKSYIDFTGETTSSSFFSVDMFKSVLNDVLERDGADALVYQELLGFEGLRESIIKNFWGNNLEIDDVLIVSGAQQGLDIISKSLINSKDGIVVEKPTYSGALAVFNYRKANIYEVEVEDDGLDLDKLEGLLKKNKINFIYLMSYFQNPTGITYSSKKKERLLKLADIYDFYIIEDDYLSELIYDSSIEYESFKKLDKSERVIYIKSFSKIFLPGIRIGYIIAPQSFRENIQNAKINSDIATSSLMQRALELYITSGHWRKHIEYLNEVYKQRYYYMIDVMKEQLGELADFSCPGGGLNFYLKIKQGIHINSFELFNECKKEDVLITPGAMFYKEATDGSRFFRLGFSQTNDDEIFEGIKKIGSILSKFKK